MGERQSSTRDQAQAGETDGLILICARSSLDLGLSFGALRARVRSLRTTQRPWSHGTILGRTLCPGTANGYPALSLLRRLFFFL